MENQTHKEYLHNNLHKNNFNNLEDKKISMLEKKFSEMNYDLAIIYESTLKDNNENVEKSNK
jgi:hypothetical protein